MFHLKVHQYHIWRRKPAHCDFIYSIKCRIKWQWRINIHYRESKTYLTSFKSLSTITWTSVFKVQRNEQLYAKLSKGGFLLEHVVLLGHVVSGRVIEVDRQKIELVFNWKYFFIIIQLIMKLVWQNSSFIWSEAYQKSFNEWKHRLNMSPILVISAGTRYYVIYSDALKHGFGYLWLNGKFIAYAS